MSLLLYHNIRVNVMHFAIANDTHAIKVTRWLTIYHYTDYTYGTSIIALMIVGRPSMSAS